ncbi:FAD-dependent oxidoreductase [Mesobacterium pallidum]|uniref:FAD-dependent oxidoreductase n=1 Tax=Mesobacterium pallidum TaxID=2872037 RepID=UPI001EE349CF|nr:FAD-dependent oxidoreductase [Mesobacterium pallidum]
MTRKIAIVGAGPSGCYLAQSLLKLCKGDEPQIDMIDRLPVPYGLVRYGVAADHQGTKAVTRQFARLFERQGVGFVGNLSIGAEGDLTLDALREAYDVVVLAAGLSRDRKLGLEGEDLDGVIGAGTLTRCWNDHPDHADDTVTHGKRVVIVGQGNVAMDVLRILAKGAGEFEGSDLSDTHIDRIAAAGIEAIDIVGRSPAHLAKFDPVMVKEIGKIAGLKFEIADLGLSEGQDDPRLEAVTGLESSDDPRCTVTFRFGWTPTRFVGEGHVTAAHFARADGTETLDIPCDAVISAVGFRADDTLERDALVAAASDIDTGRLAPGLYAAGWFRRGPRGTIPENRTDSQAVAEAIAADLADMPEVDKPGSAALFARFDHLTDYAGWQRIDAHEQASAGEGRVRRKLADRAEMLKLALKAMETTP